MSDVRIELDKKKQVSVRKFKGMVLVDIREFYLDSEGDKKPGKKGISLQESTWKLLMENREAIDKAVHELGGEEPAKKKSKVKSKEVVSDDDEESDQE